MSKGYSPPPFIEMIRGSLPFSMLRSWREFSISVIDLVRELGDAAELLRLEQFSTTHRLDVPRLDQTFAPVGECGIELVTRKHSVSEIAVRGRWQRSNERPDRQPRSHFKQYRDDLQTIENWECRLPTV